jgi:hypothetical protein
MKVAIHRCKKRMQTLHIVSGVKRCAVCGQFLSYKEVKDAEKF